MSWWSRFITRPNRLTTPQKAFDTPRELAELLFTKMVLDGESVIMRDEYQHFRQRPEFEAQCFARLRFTYLVGSLAFVFAQAGDREPATAQVLPFFQARVLLEMGQRWALDANAVANEVESAAQDLYELLYSDSNPNRTFPFHWAQRWLNRAGVEETNPHILFATANTWMRHTIDAAQVVQPMLKALSQ